MLFLSMLYVQFMHNGNELVFSRKTDFSQPREGGFSTVSAELVDEGWKVHISYLNRKALQNGKDCLSCTYLKGYYTLGETLEIAKANCHNW